MAVSLLWEVDADFEELFVNCGDTWEMQRAVPEWKVQAGNYIGGLGQLAD